MASARAARISRSRLRHQRVGRGRLAARSAAARAASAAAASPPAAPRGRRRAPSPGCRRRPARTARRRRRSYRRAGGSERPRQLVTEEGHPLGSIGGGVHVPGDGSAQVLDGAGRVGQDQDGAVRPRGRRAPRRRSRRASRRPRPPGSAGRRGAGRRGASAASSVGGTECAGEAPDTVDTQVRHLKPTSRRTVAGGFTCGSVPLGARATSRRP